MGIPWRHIVQDKILGPNKFGKYNSESQESHLTMSQFADDTTILGTAREMRTVCDAVKETMQSFGEENNTLKEERLILGAEQSVDIRMLGCWMDPRIETRNRIARAAKLWAKLKPQLIKSRLSKRQQACVETGLLFDAATRSWQKREIKAMQSWIDRTYRYIWSNKKETPSN